MTAAKMLAAGRADLGLSGRPNHITRDYAARHGKAFLEAPWCNMAITYWARKSGNAAAVLPAGDRAYTPWHADDGRDRGLWYAGTVENLKKHARPGAIVFFDWAGTNTIAAIDHVGVIEDVLDDGRVITIEGNTGDACKRRVRSATHIAGFWNPPYKPSTKPPAAPAASTVEDLVKKLPMLAKGANNYDVKTVRACLFARGGLDPAHYGGTDGLQEWLERTDFDAALDSDVKAFQRSKKLEVDGIVGPRTWAALLRVK
ncbi:peptidoglycan-binding protein [Nonomuraea sp. SYSU D8015]|uniref:peptidoglycan-binding protein n=1 Tax=Nonomuraea sp. SYSU D8015 TaxID=2593644 RepID=UPI0016613008|nr:peptidoglycan-binding protein [Nonomuraea sp. SYSU D8015]